jgi:hypothetical protein
MAKSARTKKHPSAAAKARRAKALGLVYKDGWYILPSCGGPPITNELVQRLLYEADLEDAGIKQHDDHGN